MCLQVAMRRALLAQLPVAHIVARQSKPRANGDNAVVAAGNVMGNTDDGTNLIVSASAPKTDTIKLSTLSVICVLLTHLIAH